MGEWRRRGGRETEEEDLDELGLAELGLAQVGVDLAGEAGLGGERGARERRPRPRPHRHLLLPLPGAPPAEHLPRRLSRGGEEEEGGVGETWERTVLMQEPWGRSLEARAVSPKEETDSVPSSMPSTRPAAEVSQLSEFDFINFINASFLRLSLSLTVLP